MPFILSLICAGLCLVTLIVGGTLTLIFFGHTRYRSGPEVGAEIMNDQAAPEEGQVVAQRSFFVGKAASVERRATVDFAVLKQQIAAGNCLAAIPGLLAIVGFVGVLFFGALAVLFVDILIGGVVMLIVLYVLLRMGIDFIRA